MASSSEPQKSNDDNEKNLFVLYVDHQRHPCPLSECFHATASRHLSSRVLRFPVSSTVQPDSLYCPNCLEYFDVVTGVQLGYCKQCVQCPDCQSPLSVQKQQQQDNHESIVWKCGLCEYTSQQCDIVVHNATQSLSKGRDQLLQQLQTKRAQNQQPVLEAYQHALQLWSDYDQQQKHQRIADTGWSMELLTVKMEERRKQLQPSRPLPEIIAKRRTIQEILQDPNMDDTNPEKESNNDTRDRSIQVSQWSFTTSLSHSRLPLPLPLATRKSRRCVYELQHGRPGILLKPKLNPLEGDTSLSTGHGLWYRKDSSANVIVPRVRLLKKQQQQQHHGSSFLLQVSNPTFGNIRLRLKPSSYNGRQVAEHWGTTTTNDPTIVLPDVLLDTLSQTVRDVAVVPLPEIWRLVCDTVELQSCEDVLVTAQQRLPEAVRHWQPSQDMPSSSTASVRLVAQQSSRAWWEVALAQESLPRDHHSTATGVPLALELELGHGSWESSLIVPRGEETDTVTFDLLLVWT